MNITRLLAVFISLLLAGWLYAQTDSTRIEGFKPSFSLSQPMLSDLKLTVPEMKKTTTKLPVFHLDGQQLLIPIGGSRFIKWNTPMIPSNPMSTDMESYKSQPVFKFKTGKTTFSFNVGVNTDAVRRGIDVQRMLQHQQMRIKIMKR